LRFDIGHWTLDICHWSLDFPFSISHFSFPGLSLNRGIPPYFKLNGRIPQAMTNEKWKMTNVQCPTTNVKSKALKSKLSNLNFSSPRPRVPASQRPRVLVSPCLRVPASPYCGGIHRDVPSSPPFKIRKNIFQNRKNMKIVIASDHAGYAQKEALKPL